MPKRAERKSVPSGPVRLSDLISEGKLLWAYCRDCGHERDLKPDELGLPGDTPVPEVGSRLVCSQCGGRKITTAPELHPGGVMASRDRFRTPRTE